MTAKIIDGKKIADKILDEVKQKIAKSKGKPGLTLVLVGDNPASQIYVSSKEKNAKKLVFMLKDIICQRKRMRLSCWF